MGVQKAVPVGPLVPYFSGFAEVLSRQGYTSLSSWYQLALAGHLSGWLAARGLSAGELTDDIVAEYLVARRGEGRRYGRSPKALRLLREHLRSQRAIPPAAEPAKPVGVEALLVEYRAYLLDERGMTPEAAQGYLDCVRPFVAGRVREDAIDLTSLKTSDVVGFVVAERDRLAAKTAQRTTSALRSLLRFLAVRGVSDPGLADAVPKVACRQPLLPRALTTAQKQALLDSCDREELAGRRDYAVLVLLSRMGLRGGEVAALCLDDIDWRAGEVTVTGKPGRCDRLPMPVDVGEAVCAYLICRPTPADPSERRVFLRVKAPMVGLTGGGVGQIVASAARRAGLGTMSSHRLRHTAATEMLREGVDLSAIGQVLRHRRTATTAIYARVDVEALRSLTMPWPETRS